MSKEYKEYNKNSREKITRKKLLKKGAAAGFSSLLATAGCGKNSSFFDSLLQKHFQEMSKEELKGVLQRLEKEYFKKYKKKFSVKSTDPIPKTLFGYGLDMIKIYNRGFWDTIGFRK